MKAHKIIWASQITIGMMLSANLPLARAAIVLGAGVVSRRRSTREMERKTLCIFIHLF